VLADVMATFDTLSSDSSFLFNDMKKVQNINKLKTSASLQNQCNSDFPTGLIVREISQKPHFEICQFFKTYFFKFRESCQFLC